MDGLLKVVHVNASKIEGKEIMKKEKQLTVLETERGILWLKRWFEDGLASELELARVSAPLFVSADSGVQDNLNGTERAVGFTIPEIGPQRYEIVHSLAKWKRLALARYGIPQGKGLYTDMNALRPDEGSLRTGIHSVYVDQWDWEKAISADDRSLETLKSVVRKIYKAMLDTEAKVCTEFGLVPFLKKEITFIHSEDLLAAYPKCTPKEREDQACKEHGAIFIIGIGGALPDGTIHDGRAPDYDDWSTPTTAGHKGLNGDILVWNPFIGRSFELSSMGIRVDKSALVRQLEIRGNESRLTMMWHQMLLKDQMPLSIGGGIGQSRLSMLLLHKRHIGEVQASMWPEEVARECQREEIVLL